MRVLVAERKELKNVMALGLVAAAEALAVQSSMSVEGEQSASLSKEEEIMEPQLKTENIMKIFNPLNIPINQSWTPQESEGALMLSLVQLRIKEAQKTMDMWQKYMENFQTDAEGKVTSVNVDAIKEIAAKGVDGIGHSDLVKAASDFTVAALADNTDTLAENADNKTIAHLFNAQIMQLATMATEREISELNRYALDYLTSLDGASEDEIEGAEGAPAPATSGKGTELARAFGLEQELTRRKQINEMIRAHMAASRKQNEEADAGSPSADGAVEDDEQ